MMALVGEGGKLKFYRNDIVLPSVCTNHNIIYNL